MFSWVGRIVGLVVDGVGSGLGDLGVNRDSEEEGRRGLTASVLASRGLPSAEHYSIAILPLAGEDATLSPHGLSHRIHLSSQPFGSRQPIPSAHDSCISKSLSSNPPQSSKRLQHPTLHSLALLVPVPAHPYPTIHVAPRA